MARVHNPAAVLYMSLMASNSRKSTNVAENFDQRCMERAISLAATSEAEDSRAHPKVGVVVAKNGVVLAEAHRTRGDHAEYIALSSLNDAQARGATVFTTLEPCTRRNKPKTSCAVRLCDAGVGRVVIGMLDPNPDIRGDGLALIREAGIGVSLFPTELMQQIEEMNIDFRRRFRSAEVETKAGLARFVTDNTSRPLDAWYRSVNHIFSDKNRKQSPADIFAHLVEVVGGLATVVHGKRRTDDPGDDFVPKALAWWLALCGKLSIRSVEDMLWTKFPGRCPYCRKVKHNDLVCKAMKAKDGGVKWAALAGLASSRSKPKALADWQRMFGTIYPPTQTEEFGVPFARLTEELGELAEAVRVYAEEPGYFISEASDVLAWLIHIENLREYKVGIPHTEWGASLAIAMCTAYPDICRECGHTVCSCRPILSRTRGRIAHEVPIDQLGGGPSALFMSPAETAAFLA